MRCLTLVSLSLLAASFVRSTGEAPMPHEVAQEKIGNVKIVHRLKGHTDAVYAAAYSLDGKFIATASFDSTITFIDNVSYSWHSTLRGPGTYLSTHWLSSQVKKAHCRSNVAASAMGTCVVVN